MACLSSSLDATLSAAAGGDLALLSELREAFFASIDRQIDLLQRSRCDGNWHVAAMRLKGLAASFQAEPLIALADEALEAAPGDPVTLRRLREFLVDIGGA